MATSRLAGAGAIKGAFEDLMTTPEGLTALAAGLAALGVTYPTATAGEAAAATNYTAIQAALDSGGAIVLALQGGGDVYIDKTLIIGSNTSFTVAHGTILKLAASKTCQLLRNTNAQNTVAASGFNHSVSGVCTVTENGHSRAAGDQVYIDGLGGDATLLGVKTVATSTPGVSWTFAATGTGTATGYGYVGAYVPLAGANFTRGAVATATCSITGTTTFTVTADQSANPFVDGMTVTGTGIAASTVVHGPTGATLSGVGTTWTLSAACTNGTGITVTGTPAATIVQVTETSHTKEIGDPVYVGGLGGADSFNGAVEVSAVIPGYWWYSTVGATAETATGTANVLHDNNIALSGAFDGNYRNQQPSYTNSNGCVLGNVGKYSIKDARGVGFYKYAFWMFNSTDGDIDAISFDTRSDGVHFEAPWNRINVRNLSGKNDDDVTSFTNNSLSSTWPAISSPSGQGNGDNVIIHGITPSFSALSSCVKIAGDYATASNRVGKFKISGISGKAAYGVFVNSGTVGTGTLGDSIDIDGVNLTGVSGVCIPVKFNCGATGGFSSVSLKNVPVTGANGYAQYFQAGVFGTIDLSQAGVTTQSASAYAQFDGVTVGRLKINVGEFNIYNNGNSRAIYLNGPTITELEVTANFKGVGNNGYGIYHGAGTVSRLLVNGCSKSAINQFYAQASGISAPITIMVNGFTDLSGGSDFVVYSAANCYAGNVDAAGCGAYFFAPQSTNTCRLTAGENNSIPAAKAIRNASGTVNSASGRGIKLDIGAGGATTPTGMTPLAGDIVTNTNAVGPGVYGYTAASAWQLLY